MEKNLETALNVCKIGRSISNIIYAGGGIAGIYMGTTSGQLKD